MIKITKKIPEFAEIEPPVGLYGVVMLRLERERALAAIKRRLLSCGFFLLASLAAVFPILGKLSKDMAQSGFIQYLSLLLYDFKSAASYWQDLGMTLLESLPAVTLAGFLGVLLALLISLRYVVIDIKNFFKISHGSHFLK